MAVETWPDSDKDPNEVLDYKIDWTDRLASLPASPGDTITGTPVWTISPVSPLTPLTKDSQSNTTTTTTVWLSGGVADCDYDVTCTVTTAGGRTLEVTYKLYVRNSNG